ncbi:tetratricopeptide repeat protein [Novosphingobium guangzhouense]|uniref:Cytochrome C biosynthesis protein n=1 Tax=Novosphingobium guangzhouense TaxID=1850347 RepID=A0A2K2G655_9SPHN|nr:tetratricopeptide repeat protein [Novosphingobium guangzhouense]PNU06509.1 cytochrome C biosynthesis protein [Novosphingobium guangzhouense]
MTWVLVIGLAVAVLAVLLFVLKVPRGAREAVASALLLGIAGYVTQGSPGLVGAPKDAVESVSADPAALVEGRAKVTNSGIPTNNRWVIIADGLARNGQYADAAEVLRGAIEDDPKNADAWLALANSLVAHADNMLTPPALYAFDRAIDAEPGAPGARFFLGLAYAREGKLAEARALWIEVVKNAPEDAPWRLPLAQQLMRLDAAIAAQKGATQGESPLVQD